MLLQPTDGGLPLLAAPPLVLHPFINSYICVSGVVALEPTNCAHQSGAGYYPPNGRSRQEVSNASVRRAKDTGCYSARPRLHALLSAAPSGRRLEPASVAQVRPGDQSRSRPARLVFSRSIEPGAG